MFSNDDKEFQNQSLRWECLKLASDKFHCTADEAPELAQGFYQYVITGTINSSLPQCQAVPANDTIPAI